MTHLTLFEYNTFDDISRRYLPIERVRQERADGTQTEPGGIVAVASFTDQRFAAHIHLILRRVVDRAVLLIISHPANRGH